MATNRLHFNVCVGEAKGLHHITKKTLATSCLYCLVKGNIELMFVSNYSVLAHVRSCVCRLVDVVCRSDHVIIVE